MVAKIVIYLLFQKGTHKEKYALQKIFRILGETFANDNVFLRGLFIKMLGYTSLKLQNNLTKHSRNLKRKGQMQSVPS